MGRLNEVNPNEVRIFGLARDGETPQEAADRILPQRVPLTANVIEGSLDVEPGVVLELSGGIGVTGGEMTVLEDGEVLLGKEST